MQLTIIVNHKNEIKAALLRTAARKLAKGNWFDISIVREMCKLSGFTLTAEMEAGLRILHCVKWVDIDLAALLWLVDLLEDVCK